MKSVIFIAILSLTGSALLAQPCVPTVNHKEWIAHVIPFDPDDISDILNVDIIDPNTIWATTFALHYLRSTDGGCTWQKGIFDTALNPEFVYSNQILGIDSLTAWISLYDDDAAKSHLYKTVDGGQTWTAMLTTEYASDDSYLDDIYFFNATDGLLIGDVVDGYFEMYTTIDGGKTWARVPEDNFPSRIANENGFTANVFSAVGDTIWVPIFKTGRVLKSTDKGIHWEVIDPSNITMNSKAAIEFRDAWHGLYVSENRGSWKTEDGGVSWQPITAPGGNGLFLEHIPQTSVYLLSYGPSRTFYTPREGDKWIEVDDSLDIYEIDFIAVDQGWAGRAGEMLEWIPSFVSVKEPAVAADWCQVLPNPVVDQCSVRLLRVPDAPCWIEAFSSEGSLLLQQQGYGQETILDLSRLPAGIHFLRVICDQHVANFQIIKS